jgi:hypothetical protein
MALVRTDGDFAAAAAAEAAVVSQTDDSDDAMNRSGRRSIKDTGKVPKAS